MKLYYYNDEIVDLDCPGALERQLIQEGDLLVCREGYYVRMEGLGEIVRYLVGSQGLIKVPPERIPPAVNVGRRI